MHRSRALPACPLPIAEPAPGLALSGLRLDGLLAAEVAFGPPADARIAGTCVDAWGRLAHAFAALPARAEIFLIAGKPTIPGCPGLAFLGAGRGTGPAHAAASRKATADLRALLETTVEFARFAPIDDPAALLPWAALLELPHVVELRRRLVPLHLPPSGPSGLGFRLGGGRAPSEPAGTASWIAPWDPCLDGWHRLLEVLADQRHEAALVIHLAGVPAVDARCLAGLRAAASRSALLGAPGSPSSSESWPPADAVRADLLRRVSSLESWPALAARVFVAGAQPVSDVLLATAASSLQEPPRGGRRPGDAGALPRGGCALAPCAPAELLDPLLLAGSLETLFSLEESAAVLRTPTPADRALPGVALLRSRTGAASRSPAAGLSLGRNVHRGRALELLLDEESRRLHTFVSGGTGTGKSTLLLRLALQDIEQGRGVAVLDPHGALVAELLERFPRERQDDLVVIDLADPEFPVGFNVLRIHEPDVLDYRLARDQIIDELYAFLDRTYDMRQVGGPVFETHFRGMLGLLLGTTPPSAPLWPTLMALRPLYRSARLRRRLLERMQGADVLVEEFVTEAEAIVGENSLRNMGPYVTSKFNRFTSDVSLRNMTCQGEVLDLDAVLREGKVLLFHLGKGRVGAGAASLLATQVLARLWRAALKRGAGPHRPFHLYVDEFHLLADERFAELLCEARKFGLAITAADQIVTALPRPVLRAVLANVGTVIALRSGPEDAQLLTPLLAPTFSALDLASLPNHRALVRGASAFGAEPFSLELVGPPARGCTRTARELREGSRRRHGRPREVVEREIAEVYRAFTDAGRRTADEAEAKVG